MWGFIWNLILVTFGTKYRFEYQNIISFLSRDSIDSVKVGELNFKLYIRYLINSEFRQDCILSFVYINLSLDISGFKKLSTMFEFLLRLHFWVRSFGCKDWRWLRFDFDLMITMVFLAWNLFCSNFWAKYRFDK